MAINRLKIICDICSAHTFGTQATINSLERAGFEIYCHLCADKLCLNKKKALEQGIKVYKMK